MPVESSGYVDIEWTPIVWYIFLATRVHDLRSWTQMSYKSDLQSNNVDLQLILDMINALPNKTESTENE